MDAETRSVKAMTTIGDRIYCEATPGKEFWVRVRVLDMNMQNKLNPTGEVFLLFFLHALSNAYDSHRSSFLYSPTCTKLKAECVCDRRWKAGNISIQILSLISYSLSDRHLSIRFDNFSLIVASRS